MPHTRRTFFKASGAAFAAFLMVELTCAQSARPRARDLGIKVGVLQPGPLNAITDVAGVAVGQTTLNQGENVRTGVTAILPHGGNLFREKVPGAVFVGNAFGKLAGSTQVNELGEIETPIMLTSTLNVPRVADATIDYMLALAGNEDVQSINPLVGETNDGYLNDIRGRHVGRDEVVSAIKNARGGAVDEGAVGAGTGTVAFGFKGGIGTSSRRLPAALGGYTVGVLLTCNYGARQQLRIAGIPVGREIASAKPKAEDQGSIVIVVATDAPLLPHQLRRLAKRVSLGLGRTGGYSGEQSGDMFVAFSTANPGASGSPGLRNLTMLPNSGLNDLFLATVQATEEALTNALIAARTMTGINNYTVEALPHDRLREVLKKYNRLEK